MLYLKSWDFIQPILQLYETNVINTTNLSVEETIYLIKDKLKKKNYLLEESPYIP
jgi:hypothetical protein